MKKKVVYSISSLFFIFLLAGLNLAISDNGKYSSKSSAPLALAYYGTSATNDSGEGSLIIIKEDGTYNFVKNKSVEWLSIINFDDNMVVNQPDEVHVIENENLNIRKFKSDCSIYGAYKESAGYLDTSKIYYSLFNQGFVDFYTDSSKYRSTIRWGNKNVHYCKDISEYVVTEGNDGEHIFVLSNNIDEKGKVIDLKLIKYKPKEKELIKKTKIIREEGFDIAFSRIIKIEDSLFLFYLDYDETLDKNNQKLKMLEIDSINFQILNDYEVNTYKDDEAAYYFPISKNAFYIKKEVIYFVDGFSNLYSVNTKSGEKKFHSKLLADEVDYQSVFIKNDIIYIYRYDDTRSNLTIETFSLNGNPLNILEIAGLAKKLTNYNQTRFLFNFEIMSE